RWWTRGSPPRSWRRAPGPRRGTCTGSRCTTPSASPPPNPTAPPAGTSAADRRGDQLTDGGHAVGVRVQRRRDRRRDHALEPLHTGRLADVMPDRGRPHVDIAGVVRGGLAGQGRVGLVDAALDVVRVARGERRDRPAPVV